MNTTDMARSAKSSLVTACPIPGDKFGHTLYLTWLATAGQISMQSMAEQLGVTVRTARDYVKNYQSSGDSLVLVDRRHFNSGQQRAYRIEPYRAAILEHWIMNLLEGEPLSSRKLEAQLEKAVSDRTIARFLSRSGLRPSNLDWVNALLTTYHKYTNLSEMPMQESSTHNSVIVSTTECTTARGPHSCATSASFSGLFPPHAKLS